MSKEGCSCSSKASGGSWITEESFYFSVGETINVGDFNSVKVEWGGGIKVNKENIPKGTSIDDIKRGFVSNILEEFHSKRTKALKGFKYDK